LNGLPFLDAERHQHTHHHLVARLDRLRLEHIGKILPVVEADRLRRSPVLAADRDEPGRRRIVALVPAIDLVAARDLVCDLGIERARREPDLVAGRPRDDVPLHLSDVGVVGND
jgi:hypothetical protein